MGRPTHMRTSSRRFGRDCATQVSLKARTSPSSIAGPTANTIGSPGSRPIWYAIRWLPSRQAVSLERKPLRRPPRLIPVVIASGVDPVASGIVASLNRPGGNVTGVSFISLDLAAKRLELVRELLPQVRVIALLINPDNPSIGTELTDAEVAARTLGSNPKNDGKQ